MDEEARKRNTDCVYFLASPLTCKKGVHCEFRHSEAARFHPRDCRYWLAGNCLNANCPFRHPPLDGKPASVSAPAPLPSKAALTPSSAFTTLSMPASKSRPPCYFFSQGFCSKGDRCTFLHCPSSSTSAQAVDAQKPGKEAVGCKEVEANDKPTSAVETSDPIVRKHGSQDVKPGVVVTAVHASPRKFYNWAQETSIVNDAAVTARNLGTSGNCVSSKPQSTLASTFKTKNSADLQSVKQQRLIRDEPELANYAEARQQQILADKERTRNGTSRNGLVKEASLGFVGESEHSVYDEELPYPIANTHFPRRSFSCKSTHDFGPYAWDDLNFYDNSLSSERDTYECFNLLLDHANWDSYPSSKGRHRKPYCGRRDRLRIKGDLHERLRRHRSYRQYEVSEIGGLCDCFQDMDDHTNIDERTTLDYGFRSDIREDSVCQTSSGSSPTRSDFRRNHHLNNARSLYDSRRARRCSKVETSGAGAQPRLESRIYVEDCLQTQGADTLRSEVHSTSCSGSVKHPSIKSRVFPISSSEEVYSRDSTSLRTLLQQSRKVKGDSKRGGPFVEQEAFGREEQAYGGGNYSNWFGLENVDMAGRKRKQRDSFGRCWLQD